MMINNLTTKRLIFTDDLEVTQEGRDKLLAVYRKHLLIYNSALDILQKEEGIKYKSLLKQIKQAHIDDEDFDASSFSVELYYLYRKVKNNRKSKKLVTQVQYLTYIVTNEAKYKSITIDRHNKVIKLNNIDIELKYTKDIPEFKMNNKYFVNIGYSTNLNKFKVSIFSVPLIKLLDEE